MPSPYVQTIADFMTQAARARAAGARDVAAIQARAQEQRGANTGNLIGALSNAAAGTIGAVMQERHDAPQRAMELRSRQLTLEGQEREAAMATQATAAAKDFAQWIQGRPTPPTGDQIVARYGPELGARFAALMKTLHPDPKPLVVNPGDNVIDANHPGGAPLFTAPPKAPPTREIKVRNPDGSETIKIVPDVVGGEYASPAAPPTAGSFEDYVTKFAAEKGKKVGDLLPAEIREARKGYQQADDRPPVSVQLMNQPPPPGDWTKEGAAFLATIPVQWRKTVEKIAKYEEDPTKVASMRGGMREQLTQWINQVNPAYDAGLFTNRAPTRKAFTTGVQGQQINAINTAIGHIDQLTAVAEALGNGSFVPGNALWNRVKSTFGGSAPTNFDTLKDALAGEVASVLSKGAGTVSGIAEAKEKINAANSPTQLAGYVKTLIPIMGSKLASLDYQYHQAMGEADTFSALSPEVKTILTKHGFDPAHPTISADAPTVAKEGDTKPIEGYPGTEQTFKNGKWIRTK